MDRVLLIELSDLMVTMQLSNMSFKEIKKTMSKIILKKYTKILAVILKDLNKKNSNKSMNMKLVRKKLLMMSKYKYKKDNQEL